ncbi:MAG: hypothetical protein HEQ35_26005 [Gloeotrichia echinulata IR180]|nr:hypothetical protein [Gloeotrichia echinulata DEX184]
MDWLTRTLPERSLLLLTPNSQLLTPDTQESSVEISVINRTATEACSLSECPRVE